MNTDMIEEVADLFKALSEPTRLKLLLALREEEMTVSELALLSGTSMANVSKHLSFMKRAGIVTRRKSGNLVYYHLQDDGILSMYDAVCRDIKSRFEHKGRALSKPERQRTLPGTPAEDRDAPGRKTSPCIGKNVRKPEPLATPSEKPRRKTPEEKRPFEILQPRLEGFNGN